MEKAQQRRRRLHLGIAPGDERVGEQHGDDRAEGEDGEQPQQRESLEAQSAREGKSCGERVGRHKGDDYSAQQREVGGEFAENQSSAGDRIEEKLRPGRELPAELIARELRHPDGEPREKSRSGESPKDLPRPSGGTIAANATTAVVAPTFPSPPR